MRTSENDTETNSIDLNLLMSASTKEGTLVDDTDEENECDALLSAVKEVAVSGENGNCR